MSYRWQPTSGTYAESDLAAADLAKTFEDQAAAEAWLTLFFDDLLEQGVSGVSLYEEDRLVYGPMSLNP
ncbi:hypothetical protein H5392_07250 [Tessaracoccus sp. MC1865]|uniref:hypothetical protein n=1 Tax=Tessaracoccus sp. MC1865 TaxID=2760310 RepID=UPI0015FF9B91|nr:hypothetical protein [Tessaracoccus sp. MC1865]MBB1483657.1 hypothetical protein [Tessaracoccus sp. MC1865]QTO36731.1 hypothetical protein J7D54_09625 [Tessaracoccus sp. MC1865]